MVFPTEITEKRRDVLYYPRPNYDKPKPQLRNNFQQILYT